MAINEEGRQAEIAAEVEEAARSLAHSTRTVPNPSDSYAMLGEIGAAVDHLQQVINQLAGWHGQVADGVHYNGEDVDQELREQWPDVTPTPSTVVAEDRLRDAAGALRLAGSAIAGAHVANGRVRWYDAPRAGAGEELR